MTKTQGNKLIAEFIGAKKLQETENTFSYEMYGLLECIDDGENEQHFFLPEDMKFHISWDWLMPVVEKCLQTGDNTDAWDEIFDALMTVDINTVYESVVEFIKEQ